MHYDRYMPDRDELGAAGAGLNVPSRGDSSPLNVGYQTAKGRAMMGRRGASETGSKNRPPPQSIFLALPLPLPPVSPSPAPRPPLVIYTNPALRDGWKLPGDVVDDEAAWRIVDEARSDPGFVEFRRRKELAEAEGLLWRPEWFFLPPSPPEDDDAAHQRPPPWN